MIARPRTAIGVALLAGVLAVVAIALAGRDSPAPGPSTGVAARPCGTSSTPPATYRHVVWIVMENKTHDDVMRTAHAPYIQGLARRCASAARFFAEAHPSLPNYLAMTSGSTHGIRDDRPPADHRLTAPSIFSQLGGDWRALQESMPRPCYGADAGAYAVRHNPATYFTGLAARCGVQDVRLADPPDLAARFTFITPNVCHDMHACDDAPDLAGQLRAGDRWLATWLPKILDSAEYRSGSTAVFLTWDEDDYAARQHIATLVIAPSVRPGAAPAQRFTHYSLLRTTEELLGLREFLGHAADARSMRAPFNL